MNTEYTVTLINSIDKQEFITLYKDAGWWSSDYESDLSFIDNILKDSFAVAAASLPDGRVIGMGRVLSDGCSDAYIQDVVVLSKYRKKGIGRAIISSLIDELKRHGIDWIGLIGEPGTEHFYSALGFKVMKEHIPMKLEI